jgi:hypothetical protein
MALHLGKAGGMPALEAVHRRAVLLTGHRIARPCKVGAAVEQKGSLVILGGVWGA